MLVFTNRILFCVVFQLRLKNKIQAIWLQVNSNQGWPLNRKHLKNIHIAFGVLFVPAEMAALHADIKVESKLHTTMLLGCIGFHFKYHILNNNANGESKELVCAKKVLMVFKLWISHQLWTSSVKVLVYKLISWL